MAYSLADFIYDKNSKLLNGVSERFPSELEVVSHVTGVKLTFRPISPDHPMFDQDGWDGEMAVYAPTVATDKVKALVLRHAY